MKHAVLLFALAILLPGTSSFAQSRNNQSSTEFFYYSNNGKKPLTLNTSSSYICAEKREILERLQLPQGVSLKSILADLHNTNKSVYYAELQFDHNLSAEDYLGFLSVLKERNEIYIAPCFKDQNGDKIGLSQYVYVKLRDESGRKKLEEMAGKYQFTLVPSAKYDPHLWCTISCNTESPLNALDLANILSESGNFTAAVPDLMPRNIAQCTTSDTYFGQQWGLQNTGQNGGTVGVDINMCDAWSITTGSSNVKIAIQDEGFDMSHPDLQSNVYGTGFDGPTQSSPSLLRGPHGTPVAGIAAARRNNGIGVSGVAPSCKLISISQKIAWQPTPAIALDLAHGFEWAYQNGVDVINNSWSSNSFSNPSPIDGAIQDAVTQGRGGKGTVVVFSTGNDDHPYLYYPSFNQNVMAVGAISPCGERKSPSSCDNESWGSNYGDALDIMAPGVFMPSSDLTGSSGYASGDYLMDYGGTSAAAPVVAGVAALMISENPCMTEKQVRSTIEATAQKMGNYPYSTHLDKPNGIWDNQMGYGVIDAYQAVKAAQELYSPGVVDLFIKDVQEDFGAEPASYSANADLWLSNDIWTRNSLDGIEQHQNVVYTPSDPTAYVYVRIRNKSCLPSLGTEKVYVYFAKGGPYANWPAPWTNTSDNPPYGREIGYAQIPIIPPGGEAVVHVTWNNVPNPADYVSDFPPPNEDQIYHFCILARIVASNDLMNSELNGVGSNNVLAHNLRFNNNIAMKNMNIINFEYEGGIQVNNAALTVGNLTASNHNYNLHFTPPAFEVGYPITGEAEVKIILDNNIWQKWQANGALGSGVRILDPDAHELLVTGPDAYLNSLPYSPGELDEISVQFNFFTEAPAEKNNFSYNVTQIDDSTGAVINGSNYLIIRPEREKLFLAELDSTGSSFSSTNLSLTAKDIQENASYRWFTADTVLVDTGKSITINSMQAIPALLEITADTDGYKDYSPLAVSSLMNSQAAMSLTSSAQAVDSIISLTPNPTNNQVTVNYQLSSSTQSAILKVTSVNNPAIFLLTSSLDNTQSYKILTLGAYPPGVYVLSLYCNGQLKDTKQLVLQ